MAKSGSLGVNYKKQFLSTDISLPAGLLQRGSNKLGEFIFVKAGAAIAQYAWVGYDAEGDAAELTTTTYAATCGMGVSQIAVDSGAYFWLWIGCGGGTASGIKGKVAANYAAFALINTTATDGVADDSATKILGGVVGLTTDAGAGSSVELYAAGLITKVTA